MIIIYSVIISILIVCGQTMWKSAIIDVSVKNIQIFTPSGFLQLIITPKIIIGTIVYGLATIAYIYLLSKYNYFQAQSIVVGSSLVLTLLVATNFFGEQPSFINVVGIALIVFGSILIISR